MEHALAALLEVLRRVEPDAGLADVLDWLWLAARMDAESHVDPERWRDTGPSEVSGSAASPVSRSKPSEPASKTAVSGDDSEHDTESGGEAKDNASHAELRTAVGPGGEFRRVGDALPFLSPGGRALARPLDIARALRPLVRRVAAPDLPQRLDEESSIRRLIEAEDWTLAFRPQSRPWLDLSLVIDVTSSMRIWQRMVRELHELLARFGAFSDLRLWRLDADPRDGGPRLRTGAGEQARSHRELLNPARASLILVVSDCMAPLWQRPSISEWLDHWGRVHPLGLLQVLPDQRLWAQGALGTAARWAVSPVSAASPNAGLRRRFLSAPLDETDGKRVVVPLPMTTLDPGRLRAWAGLVAGISTTELVAFSLRAEARPPEEPVPVGWEVRLEAFMSSATPMARRLASLLAAAPLRLPVIRLVQRALLPGSDQTHLAEVFLSGLIRRVWPPGGPDRRLEPAASEDPEAVDYDFLTPELREQLLESGLINDAVNVQICVGDYLARHIGGPNPFLAAIRSGGADGMETMTAAGDTFAQVTHSVLDWLGLSPVVSAPGLPKFGQPDHEEDLARGKRAASSDADWLRGLDAPPTSPAEIERRDGRDRILHDFHDLLRALPRWTSERYRRRLAEQALGKGHRVMKEVEWALAGASDIAWDLPSACEDFPEPTPSGLSPLCALLEVCREDLGRGNDALLKKIAFLQERLQCATAEQVDWPYAPYPGMLALDRHQAPIFFGRGAETQALLDKLDAPQGRRLLLVTGASGSGKSSVVRAGLWATLLDRERSTIPGSTDWVITAMRPSKPAGDPCLALAWSIREAGVPGFGDADDEAAALREDPTTFPALLQRVLAGRPRHAEWLLILDQLDELFTSVEPERARRFLEDLLLPAIGQPRFRVVATVRSDFLDRCIAHPALCEELNADAQFGVSAPGPAKMAAMIEGPVRRLRLAQPVSLEDRLVDQLVSDASGRAGGLALLAFALKDLYEACKARGHMGLADYLKQDPDDPDKRVSGLDLVIAERANQAVQRARVPVEQVLPRVFCRLLALQPKGPPTRLSERLSHWSDDPEALRLIAALSDRETRLLVSSDRADVPADPTAPAAGDAGHHGAMIEVAHEALFSAWPELEQWIDRRREALLRQPQVERDAARWDAAGRPDGRVYKAAILTETRDLLEGAELWQGMARDARIAHFLARDDAGELLGLAQHAFDERKRGDGADATCLDLLRTLTAEGRRADTVEALGERIVAEQPALADWLRTGILTVIDRLGGDQAAPWLWRRVRLGDVLAAIGDDREGIGVRDGLPDTVWQSIPAGGFLWQDGETRETGVYRIARYPVTNRQYQAFIEAEDYADPQWWQEGYGAPEPARPQWNQPNRPRVEVTWVEAVAFCRWLTARFRAQGLIGGEEEIRLPTEYEWEKAVRGTDGRTFPWGEGYRSGDANIDETYDQTGPLYLRETTAVGLYPRNVSPYGVVECSGNVWEWCLNKYDDPDDTSTAGEAMCALRGGSWDDALTFARAAARRRLVIDYRNHALGFRLLCSVHIHLRTRRPTGPVD